MLEPTPMPSLPPEPPPISTPTPMPSLPPEPPPISTPTPIPTPTPTLPPMDPTLGQFQQEMLDAVNTARSSSRNCGITFRPAVGMLKWNGVVEDAAIIHSSDMANTGNFSHIGTDGGTPGDRLNDVGYDWRGYGENIAFVYTSIDDVMQGWLDSPGHCNNIMNPDWIEMGSSEIDLYWTQVFTIPK